MKTEDNKRMEALAYIIADLKAKNMELDQSMREIAEKHNDVLRQLRGMEKRKDEDPSRQTLGEMMQMRDHCDKLEAENRELKRFAKAIRSFAKGLNLYMKKDVPCPYYPDKLHVCSKYCLECDSCLDVIEDCGVICAARLADAEVSFPKQ